MKIENTRDWLTELGPGDRVIVSGRHALGRVATVERTTKTLIIVSGGLRVRKRDGYAPGGDLWNHTSIVEATPESIADMRERRLRQKLINGLAAVRWKEIDLVGPMWKLALTRLYLLAGMYIPHRAKVAGATRFGFCDSDGEQQPRAQATHFGWTAGR